MAALEDRYLVIDAPASGSAVELLSVSSGVKGIAPTGTLNRLADSIDSFLCDPTRFGAVITMTPEDLAVREALETATTIRDRLGIATVAAIVNCVPDSLFDTADLAAISPLGAHTQLAIRRNAAHEQAALVAPRFESAGLPTIKLPMMFTPSIGRTELEKLGRAMKAELLD